MSLTIEKPETEARLHRFATTRGLSPQEALDELLDGAEEEQESSLDTIPDILMRPAPDDLKKALEEMDAGDWVSGADFLAEFTRSQRSRRFPSGL
ncbi:hypothetical protein [Armatimonas sp.]|uniref:hypothetical protein n=1 Tax=Armatimonas sp. TaxID=1872638 RepID=UPI00286B6BE5|nr:hypothetical protein [Armatimonas sp.]